jgi:hypothetical protein
LIPKGVESLCDFATEGLPVAQPGGFVEKQEIRGDRAVAALLRYGKQRFTPANFS